MAGIELINVHKQYRVEDRAVPVLRGIGLQIPERQITVILGRSGCGKTTLLRLTGGLEEADAGEVRYEGPHRTAFVFQEPRLMPWLTVWGNVIFGLEKREISRKKVEDIIATVGLTGFEKAYPSQLSGGMQQRTAIARALASNPKVLLCDEATSALDPTTTRSILRLIQDINRRMGITAVIITHEMAVVEEICSHVAILERGRMVETGTVEAVFSNPQTEAGRRLVFPEGANIDKFPVAGVVRVVFNGGSSYEPLIASLAIDCGVKVNILGADTRNVNGKAFGSMLLGLPEDHGEAVRAMNYLKAQKDVTVEEVPDYHG